MRIHHGYPSRRRKFSPMLAALAFLPLLVACAGQQTALDPKSEEATSIAIAQVNNNAHSDFVLIWQVFGTPTLTPTLDAYHASIRATNEAQLTATAGLSGNSQALAATAAAPVVEATLRPGDPVKGQQVFTGPGGCFACHDTSTGNTIVGPSLKGVASRAGGREPGKSADDYLHESILTPNAYVVNGFSAGIMPQSFSKSLSAQQIEDVVAYLETLK